jgi:hypothetical protein
MNCYGVDVCVGSEGTHSGLSFSVNLHCVSVEERNASWLPYCPPYNTISLLQGDCSGIGLNWGLNWLLFLYISMPPAGASQYNEILFCYCLPLQY